MLLGLGLGAETAISAPLGIADAPLFSAPAGKGNVLMIIDNSNSMDEDPTGFAVGSQSANSKSEILRSVVRQLARTYTGRVNMGLMAYQQQNLEARLDSGIRYLYNAFYDVSYDPDNYRPDLPSNSRRDLLEKRFRVANTSDPGNFIHYNVVLPSYEQNDNGPATFCYSSTADFDNFLEVYPRGNPDGNWDTYRCFSGKTGISDGYVSSGIDPSDPITTEEAALGFDTLLTSSPYLPTDSDLARNILDFGRHLATQYVTPSWFSDRSPGRGFLHVPLRPLDIDGVQADAIEAKLRCNVPATATPASPGVECAATGIRNAGLTPLAGTLYTALDYFTDNLRKSAEGYVASGANATSPLPQSCGRNYVVLVTDGMPTTDPNGLTYPISPTGESTAVRDAANAARALKSSDVTTFVVGFALPERENPLDEEPLDQIARAGSNLDTDPNSKAFMISGASDRATAENNLMEQMKTIFGQIGEGSASAVASNSGRLDAGGTVVLYQAAFDDKWNGRLRAFTLSSNGAVSNNLNDAIWDAADVIPPFDSRKLFYYTYDPAVPRGEGAAFDNFDNLTATEREFFTHDGNDTSTTDDLGEQRFNYIRGDNSREERNGGPFRNRLKNLGDIVNSSPAYVGSGNFRYALLPGAEGSSYLDFRSDSGSYSTSGSLKRRRMLYVGANDGMLHGFDAGSRTSPTADFSTGSGQEVFGFIPNAVLPRLNLLTAPRYAHRYFVDGTPRAADAYVNLGSGPRWRTLLAGTTGAGAKSVFMLDVTEPDSFAADDVLWEISDTVTPDGTDLTDQPNTTPKILGFTNHLGYTFSEVSTVRMRNAQWVSVFGNGYGSVNNKAVLYIVDAATGNLVRSIDTGAGDADHPNGLSTPITVDSDGDLVVDAIYAGDLLGNLWKFDVSSSDVNQWKVAFTSGANPAPLFVACAVDQTPCEDENRQPITAKPQVGAHLGSGTERLMVYFGTGKYFENVDNTVDRDFDGDVDSDVQMQTFYGILDAGAPVDRRNKLQPQYISAQTTLGVSKIRVTTECSPDFAATPPSTTPGEFGWYMDLLTPTSTQTPSCTSAPGSQKLGERVVSAPVLRGGRIIFSTLTPKSDPCAAGGDGWLMELEAETGKRLPNTSAPWDLSGSGGSPDGAINASDLGSVGGSVFSPSGKQSTVGIIGTPAIVSSGQVEYKITGGSLGKMESTRESAGRALGRQSWTQLR